MYDISLYVAGNLTITADVWLMTLRGDHENLYLFTAHTMLSLKVH